MAMSYGELKKAVAKLGNNVPEIEKLVKAEGEGLSERQKYLCVCAGIGIDAEEEHDKAEMVEDAVKKDQAMKAADAAKEAKLKAFEAKRLEKGLAINRVSA